MAGSQVGRIRADAMLVALLAHATSAALYISRPLPWTVPPYAAPATRQHLPPEQPGHVQMIPNSDAYSFICANTAGTDGVAVIKVCAAPIVARMLLL